MAESQKLRDLEGNWAYARSVVDQTIRLAKEGHPAITPKVLSQTALFVRQLNLSLLDLNHNSESNPWKDFGGDEKIEKKIPRKQK